MSDSNKSTKIKAIIGFCTIVLIFSLAFMSGGTNGPMIQGIRAEFFLFALTLLGVALLHDFTLEVAVVGLVSVVIMKLIFISDFDIIHQVSHEGKTLINLFGLLVGFAILAKHFESSNIPEILPKYLPMGWMGGFVLLVLVFFMSSFLDNIAAAMIGGTIALTVFNKNVHIGYIAAIVAASNAGGSGSVLGDTTTTMMWIKGVGWHEVTHAYYAAVPALLVCGVIGSIQQDKFHPISKSHNEIASVKWIKILITFLILVGAILTNVYYDFPALGVWIAIIVGALITKTPWDEIPKSLKGTFFLLSLVMCASLMPVNDLPAPSAFTAFGLGFVSAVFDNIPLTQLALTQGATAVNDINSYDWGILAFAVGFGGSMIWFGSSAGVAISNTFPQAKSVGSWLKSGWHVTLAYIISFAIMYGISGWHPHKPNKVDKTMEHSKSENSELHEKVASPTSEVPSKSEATTPKTSDDKATVEDPK